MFKLNSFAVHCEFIWPIDQETSDYERVKEAVLKAYPLVPHAYRRRFRARRKFDTESLLEYAKEKRVTFIRWLRGIDVHSFGSLSELMVIGELLNHVRKDVAIFIAEREVEILEETAMLADHFYFARRVSVGNASVGGRGGQKPTSYPHI